MIINSLSNSLWGDVMPTELPKQYYNLMFTDGGKEKAYHKGPRDSFMFVLWDAIARKVEPGTRVAEFGCGAGQLAVLLMEYGCDYVLGVDIAERGLDIARQLNPNIADRFYEGSLYNPNVYRRTQYDMAIFCEVLEHLDHDLSALRGIPSGMKVIISVPTAESKEHVRCFPLKPDGFGLIREHYGREIEIEEIETVLIPINNPNNEHYWYIITGRKW